MDKSIAKAINAAMVDITAGMVKVGETARKAMEPFKVTFRNEVAPHIPRTADGKLDEGSAEFKAIRKVAKIHYFGAQSTSDWYDVEFAHITNGEGVKVWRDVASMEGTLADDTPRFKATAALALGGGKFEKSIAMEIIQPLKKAIQGAERQAWNALKAAANPKKVAQGKRDTVERFDEVETTILNLREERETEGFQVASKAELVKAIKAVRKALSM